MRMTNPAGGQRGQMMVLFALMLTVLIGAVGLGIDAAQLYGHRVRLQGIADLAALGGADLLGPAGGAFSAAETRARQIVANNDHVSTTPNTLITSHAGGAEIEVELVHPAQTFFMQVLGFNTVNVRAKARARGRVSNYAIFAAAPGGCSSGDLYKTIDMSGSGNQIVGKVHSNSGMYVGGSNNQFSGVVTYNCLQSSGAIHTSTSPYPLGAVDTTTHSFPANFTYDSLGPCTFGPPPSGQDFDLNSSTVSWNTSLPLGDPRNSNTWGGSWWVNPSTKTQLKSGVYCLEDSSKFIKLSTSGVTGNITFVSNGKIEIGGGSYTLTPYRNNVLMWAGASGPSVIKLNGSTGTWAGLIIAPYGQVETSGSGNLTVQGSILAWTVKVNGSGLRVEAPPEDISFRRLVQ
jgi:hypothetical protein